jgi:hypothetical protein
MGHDLISSGAIKASRKNDLVTQGEWLLMAVQEYARTCRNHKLTPEDYHALREDMIAKERRKKGRK